VFQHRMRERGTRLSCQCSPPTSAMKRTSSVSVWFSVYPVKSEPRSWRLSSSAIARGARSLRRVTEGTGDPTSVPTTVRCRRVPHAALVEDETPPPQMLLGRAHVVLPFLAKMHPIDDPLDRVVAKVRVHELDHPV